MKYLAVMTLVLGLSACTMIPEELAVAEGTSLVSYSEALTDPASAIGKTARWGGVIAEVRNTDSGTEIEVVNFALQGYGRPQATDESDGRFRAKLDTFVDPVVYAKGRSVTFTGTIAAPEEGKIDEFNYLFPVLQVRGKYLWKEIKETRVEVDYSSLWYRHHYYAPPYRIYYPVPVTPSHNQGKTK